MKEDTQDEIMDSIDDLIVAFLNLQNFVSECEEISPSIAEDILNQIKEMTSKAEEFAGEF